MNISTHTGFQTYKRLLQSAKPYWVLFVFGAIATVIVSGTDATFTGLIKPIIDESFIKRDRSFIHWLPILIFGIFIIRGMAGFISSYCISRVARTVVRDLRRLIFSRLLQLPASFYDRNGSGYILSTIVYNVEQVAQACSDALMTIIRESSLAIGLIVVMFVVSWKLSLLFIVIAPFIMWVVKWSSVRMRRLSANVQQSVGDVTHVAGEGIDGYRVVRLYGGQEYENKKFKLATKNNLQRELKIVVTNGVGTSSMQLLLAIPIAITLLVATNPALHISAGSFGAIVAAMISLLRPVRRMSMVNTEIQKGVAAAESIFKMADETVEQDVGTRTLSRVKGDIVFHNVNFKYDTSTQLVLKQINFSVKAGQTVAIVGKSGGGKSTLVNLLPRFYEIHSGDIRIDGVNINVYRLAELRKQFAFVSQDTTLFDDTIANNIAYGSSGLVERDKIISAATAANAMEFILQMPAGLDTQIGEDGVLLSGGQRQRIAIARALLKDAPILILDEATASLDVHAERHIQSALDDLMKDRTVLVIAHRLSTVENADCIIVLDDGEIVETGTHRALLQAEGVYAALYHAQFKE
ncbi:MAG: lipid A export permease/ATP-binding protein MsbA [Gammaproteobacteria bacterium CG_4_10_14_0_8_um_filter_38_16]|nr:MAG: lipid A export permease/ATP-binding protein MsbA [Gammaproteobacteria bacterium CG_4_10_14_0_8_um_filter_38_16]PJA04352.1 MAG: lipid A export permease/ATP-binding protein MsbA [Gammaproteobacteria bacterium CG_4_10_14_0_2_um_filter_38_22]PJB09541.1 MAG: lipid A export permease/ATP-binding protein MsbA [Gammaproteobacteria bacterium CG_4_9_14_3_um_filter_38_9]